MCGHQSGNMLIKAKCQLDSILSVSSPRASEEVLALYDAERERASCVKTRRQAYILGLQLNFLSLLLLLTFLHGADHRLGDVIGKLLKLITSLMT